MSPVGLGRLTGEWMVGLFYVARVRTKVGWSVVSSIYPCHHDSLLALLNVSVPLDICDVFVGTSS